jgi:pyruvate formate lyase activating enzyme
MKVNYAGFCPISTIDWQGHSVATVFLRGCPLNCEYCQNREYISGDNHVDIDIIKEEILKSKPFISGVVFSGGEPLMQHYAVHELALFAKSHGLLIGIHTNGFYQCEAMDLIFSNVVDKFFVDLKAPFSEPWTMAKVIRGKDEEFVHDVIYDMRESSKRIFKFADVEFRTTIISDLIGNSYQISQIARWMHEYLSSEVTYVLQQGNPEHCIDETLRRSSAVSRDELYALGEVAARYLRDVRIRTKEKGEEKIERK